MPNGVNNVTPDKSKTTISKTAETSLPDGTQGRATEGENPESLPQAPVNPRVNVSGKDPHTQHTKKMASHYALPALQRYPLDSFSDVEKAAAYFGQWRGHFSPGERHEYCENLVKRASALGCPVSEEISKYGSSSFAPVSDLQVALDGRRNVVSEQFVPVLDKLAQARIEMTPDLFAETLSEFDKTAGIDHLYDQDIMDPYYSTYGTKLAQEEDDDAILVGNDYMTIAKLKSLGKRSQVDLKGIFDISFIKEFREDPVGIFKSLPVDQKKVIMRIAASSGYNA
jgi:hypothetical protein